MISIETDVYAPNPDKEGFVQYQGQRLMSEVYGELKAQVEGKFKDDENVVFDYIALDFEMKDKATLFPKGYICVFVLPGSSEAYRVNLCVFDANGGYTQIASVKIWSYDGAHEVCKYIYALFYGKRGNL